MPRLTAEGKARKAVEDARKAKAHERYVVRAYGLSAGEYAARLDAQQGRCAICGNRPRNRRLAVDHNHETGEVRGLLCYQCNHFLVGAAEFNPIAAHNAAVYLAGIANDFDPGFDPLHPALVEPDSPYMLLHELLKEEQHGYPDDGLPF